MAKFNGITKLTTYEHVHETKQILSNIYFSKLSNSSFIQLLRNNSVL